MFFSSLRIGRGSPNQLRLVAKPTRKDRAGTPVGLDPAQVSYQLFSALPYEESLTMEALMTPPTHAAAMIALAMVRA